jgi:alpha-amylase
VNLLNVLSRRPEAYHRSLVEAAASGTLVIAGQPIPLDGAHRSVVRAKEEGLERRLIYDTYRHAGLVDHVFAPGSTLDSFYRCTLAELGDFVGQPYTARVSKVGSGVSVSLVREGHVAGEGGRSPLRVEKKIAVRPADDDLSVTYSVTNLGEQPVSARFGVETNWGISGGDSSEGAYVVFPGGTLKRLNEITETPGVKEAAIVHEHVGRVVIRASEEGTWWQFPIETVSNSEAGFERVYQGTSLLTHWPLTLDPAGLWKLTLKFALVPASD